MTIGPQDVFERHYEALFRAQLAPFGEFVMYERDRAARDIGIHLTAPRQAGGERLTASLCWFQLKGIRATTLPAEKIRKQGYVPIALSTEHLQFWYLQPSATWLALYAESVDTFYILNLQAYVEKTYGNSIFDLAQKSLTVRVPVTSLLDQHALSLILRAGELPIWARITKDSLDDLRFVQRDATLIWRLGTSTTRNVEHYVRIIDWQSKLRGEVHFYEREIGSEQWTEIRAHIEYLLRADDVQEAFPYLELQPTDSDDGSSTDDGAQPLLQLSNGTAIHGTDASSEYFRYDAVVSLNGLGLRLFAAIDELQQVDLIFIDIDGPTTTDSAPWHRREV